MDSCLQKQQVSVCPVPSAPLSLSTAALFPGVFSVHPAGKMGRGDLNKSGGCHVLSGSPNASSQDRTPPTPVCSGSANELVLKEKSGARVNPGFQPQLCTVTTHWSSFPGLRVCCAPHLGPLSFQASMPCKGCGSWRDPCPVPQTMSTPPHLGLNATSASHSQCQVPHYPQPYDTSLTSP